MAAHARLKNEFTEDEKCHNLMSWLKLRFLSCNSPLGMANTMLYKRFLQRVALFCLFDLWFHVPVNNYCNVESGQLSNHTVPRQVTTDSTKSTSFRQ